LKKPKPQRPAPIPRAKFRESVVGKTPDEVIAAAGKPDSTSESGRGTANWYYQERTVDPVTEKLDGRVQVVFEDGRVSQVNF
jgi:hypothetical protein